MVKEHVTTAETEDFQIKYFRIKQLSTGHGDAEVGEGFHVFGICVVKCAGNHVLEQADSGPLTYDADKVGNTIALLAANTVTPMTLYEILDELEV